MWTNRKNIMSNVNNDANRNVKKEWISSFTTGVEGPSTCLLMQDNPKKLE